MKIKNEINWILKLLGDMRQPLTFFGPMCEFYVLLFLPTTKLAYSDYHLDVIYVQGILEY